MLSGTPKEWPSHPMVRADGEACHQSSAAEPQKVLTTPPPQKVPMSRPRSRPGPLPLANPIPPLTARHLPRRAPRCPLMHHQR